MIIEQILPKTPLGVLAVILSLLAAKLVVNRFGGGLNGIPGPFAASFTDWWRVFIVWGRRPELTHIKLHEKYGPLVRLGPRTVSVGNAEAIKTIYALNAGFVKSGFYPVQQTIANGHCLQSMFNTTDEKFHARLRRSVSNAYSMSTLVNFEPLVDSTSEEFLKQLKQRYTRNEKAKGELDFGQWLQFYAFDVIGELTYSKRLGFVDRGEDVDDIIHNLEGLLNYVAVVGQLPILDKLLLKNPFRMWMSKHNLLNFNSPKEAQEELPAGKPARKDFLSRFKDARKKDPDFISEERVLALTVANMFAGSDTTAISLRAVFYLLLKHPQKMEKLLHELSTESQAGRFARPDALVQWEEVRSLPYLSAVINEALRCHPAAGLTLERVVPSQGIDVAGQRIPGGTVVGCSAWVVHRDESVFGSRTDEFRPERWIDANPAELSLMKSCLFSFGAGSRTCIGKNISLLEIFKLVPAILRTFELELVDPDSPWVLHNAWFVKQSNFFVRLKERESIL
ncbi:Cytochrome monooxygenase like protein [Verticillium longisporum]|nr:Cytochrome monooxygenase like protein [Verticillium longisporum]